MYRQLTKAFSRVKYATRPDLAENVWRTIILRDKQTASYKLLGVSFVGFASFVGLVPTTRMLLNDFTQSGFNEFLSLLFSDGRILISLWREFAFTLAEALPVLSVLLSLSLILVFCLSIKYAMKQITGSQLSFSV